VLGVRCGHVCPPLPPDCVTSLLLALVFNLTRPVHEQKATKDFGLLAVQSKCLTYFTIFFLKHCKSK